MQMKLTILGSGTSVIRKQRKGPSFLLEINKKLLLFDCGSGIMNIPYSRYSIQNINHIFITHPHADHMGNLTDVLQSMHVSGSIYPKTKRNKTLYIHGYRRFKEDYEKLRNIMFPERVEKYKIKIFEYLNTKRKIDNLIIKSKEVKHVQEYFHSVAFRIQ